MINVMILLKLTRCHRSGADLLVVVHDLHPLVPRLDLDPASVPGPGLSGLGDPEAADQGPGHCVAETHTRTLTKLTLGTSEQ